jgi:ribokinase
MSIVVVGSLNADFVLSVERFPAPGETVVGSAFAVFSGGKGANQAYAVARLGGRVHLVGQVGGDAQAGWLTQHLAAGGVDVTHVRRDETVSSGMALITIDAAGQNQIVIVPGANGTFGVDHLRQSRELISGSRLLLLQLEIPLETVVAAARIARRGGAMVILDPAPARAIPDSLLRLVDYVTPNETELVALTGGAALRDGELGIEEAARRARQLLKRGARCVLVKLGARGALLVAPQAERFWPAVPVSAVDTTAAGDAFNGAFAFALAEDWPEDEAGRFAVAAAACSVTRKGAQPSMPTCAEVKRLMAES